MARLLLGLQSAYNSGGSQADPVGFGAVVAQARAAAQAARLPRSLGYVERVAAQDRLDQGELDAAFRDLEAARSVLAEDFDVELRALLGEIGFRAGRLAQARLDLAAAESAIERAEASAAGLAARDDREAARAAELRLRLARCAGLQVEIALRLGQPEPAAVALSRAERWTPHDEPDAVLDLEAWRIQLALLLEDFEEGIAIAERASTRAGESAPWWRAAFQIRRGIAESELARQGGDARRAEATLEAALVMPGLEPQESETGARVLADLALRRGDVARARSLLDGLPRKAARTVDAREALLAATQELQVSLAERAPADAVRDARDTLARSLDTFYFDLDEQRGVVSGLGYLAWGTQRAALSELVRAELALEPGQPGCLRALEHVLRAQSHGALTRSLGASDARLDDVRELLLADGAGLLVLLPAMDRTHVFACDTHAIVHAETAGRDAILSIASGGLARRLAAPPVAGADERARDRAWAEDLLALGALLLPPAVAVRVATWSEVRLVGVDLCGAPPVELLRLPDGEELGLRLPVSHLPSLAAGVGLARRAARRARDGTGGTGVAFAALVDPAFDPGLAIRHRRLVPLGLGARELERFAGPAAARGPNIRIGPEATIDALRTLLELRPTLCLVVAHGLHEPSREFPAGLALAPGVDDDGVLWADAASRLHAPPFLALLACGGGRGRPRLGDDLAGHFGGAFLAAGSDAVLVSRADLALESAAVVAETLRARDGAISPARALLEARQALARDPRTRDPFHRAHLVLFAGPSRETGASDPVARGVPEVGAAASPARWRAAAVIAFLVALSLGWWVRRRAGRGSAARHRAAAAPCDDA